MVDFHRPGHIRKVVHNHSIQIAIHDGITAIIAKMIIAKIYSYSYY